MGEIQQDRAEVLERAVSVIAQSDADAVDQIFTEDVVVWSSVLDIHSRAELDAELRTRDVSFPDFTVEIRNIDVTGEHGYVEWIATTKQTEPLVIDEMALESTAGPLTLHGVSVADFDGDRIRHLRQYWNEGELLEGMGLLPTS